METRTSSPAESMVDQTKMTRVLTHGSAAQESHGRDNHSEELVKNSPCLDQQMDGSGEKEKMGNGDHSNLITSGITTTEPELFATIWASLTVPEPKLETTTTEKLSMLKLDTEDVLLTAINFLTAESTEDQITETEALMLMSDVQDNGNQLQLESPDLNSESQVQPQVLYTEKDQMENGDHLLLTTSGITTTVPELFVKILDLVKV
jgi:hypothetical protein